MSVALVAQATDTAVPLDLTITAEGVGGVTGKSPTVAIRDATTTTDYLDWTDSTFKAAGWTNKYGTMTEIERGHYQRSLDATAVAAIVSGSVLVAEFYVDDGASTVGVGHDLISFEPATLAIADVQTAMTNQGYTTTRAPYHDELAAANIPADLDAVLADTSAIDGRLPSDPADESLQQASHTTTQAAIAALNDLTSQQIRDAMKLAPSAGAFASGSLDLLATEVWQLLGLEVGSPVVNTPTSRKVPADGSIVDQTVVTAGATVTVSRS